MAFFVIRESDALSRVLDISIAIEGVEVLKELQQMSRRVQNLSSKLQG